ncbi:MAG: glycerol-3-phosphate dehydrogenase/oxidase [Kiloniellales bacterium]|nr:glycerol-3-phosphate dehydrogenase/oxidase [Kiloniellales bacterium]
MSQTLSRDTTALHSRDALMQTVRHRGRFQVLIVGAGINGLGTFRDLSLQGVDCLIVDKGDFCSGASAAPSRMIHGGLKYLETGAFRLVAEATHERNRLLKNAAHLVQPLEMVIPLHSRTGGFLPALRRFFDRRTPIRTRGALIVKAGLALYDFLGRRDRVLPRHRMVGRADAHAATPGLDPAIVAAGVYYDAWITAPERLAVELALDGMAANGRSVALNYLSLVGARNGTIELRDELTGEVLSLETDLVVNAAGAWIDTANRELAVPGRLIGGTKGSHLILDAPELHDRLAGRMVYFESPDGRVCLLFPYLGKVLLGSTDIPVDDPDRAFCEDEEIDYILAACRSVFPEVAVAREQIVFTYCGVRPLPASPADDPGAVSRDHSIAFAEPTPTRPYLVMSLVGGKWTTFRAFAEEAADAALKHLGGERRVSTAELPIGGGRGLSQQAESWDEIEKVIAASLPDDHRRASRLAKRYGSRGAAVARYCAGGQDRPLQTLPDYSLREIEFIVRGELVAHLQDFVLGRSTIAITGRLHREAAEELSEVLARVLGWDETRRRAEVTSLETVMRQRHRIDLDRARLAPALG